MDAVHIMVPAAALRSALSRCPIAQGVAYRAGTGGQVCVRLRNALGPVGFCDRRLDEHRTTIATSPVASAFKGSASQPHTHDGRRHAAAYAASYCSLT